MFIPPNADNNSIAQTVNGQLDDTNIRSTAAIALSKLATGALPTAITVASANIVDGTIVNTDVNASAALALSKLATGALPTGITIVDANVDAAAAIGLTKLVSGVIWTTWTPVFSGFSVGQNPTVVARYMRVFNLVFLYMITTVTGVSNATTFSLTAPVTSGQSVRFPLARATDNGTAKTSGSGVITANTTTVDLFPSLDPTATWTNSGNKFADFLFFYEV